MPPKALEILCRELGRSFYLSLVEKRKEGPLQDLLEGPYGAASRLNIVCVPQMTSPIIAVRDEGSLAKVATTIVSSLIADNTVFGSENDSNNAKYQWIEQEKLFDVIESWMDGTRSAVSFMSIGRDRSLVH
ncbi:hypothetical protein CHU98_g2409 [Xylaria longipes]|nr:hypothetical protein CHU98_g2409 [Xylaria longipes]